MRSAGVLEGIVDSLGSYPLFNEIETPRFSRGDCGRKCLHRDLQTAETWHGPDGRFPVPGRWHAPSMLAPALRAIRINDGKMYGD